MKRILPSVLLLLFISVCSITKLNSQNLVTNPDFETISGGCAFSGYGSMTGYYYTDTCSSPDRFSTCSFFQALLGAPANGQGNQAPHSGTAYAGFISYDNSSGSTSYREYVGGTLSTTLTAGQSYCVGFYISLSDNSPIAVNRLGVYFSPTQIFQNLHASDCIGTSTTLNVTPQLQAASTITDKTNWVLVQWTYVATGNERYFAIGNFYDNANTTRTNVGGGASAFSYYYIDDISVAPGSCSSVTAAATGTNASCNGQCNGTATANLTSGTGAITYAWSSGGTTQTISNLCAGTYTVTATDALANSATASYTVTQPTAMGTSPSATATTCGSNNGSASVTPSGGSGAYTYAWNNGGTTSSINNLAPGNYSVTVTNNGCSVTAIASVASSSGITATTSTTSAGCSATGSATANITAGTGPFTYSWNNGATTQTASNLSGGNYTVTVTGAGNCTASATAVVAATGTGVSLSSSATPAHCGNNNGIASVNVTSGTGPFTYDWSNGGTTSSLLNLASGVYTVTVTGSGNCTATASINVSSTAGVSVTTSGTNAGCTSTGSATVTVTAGTGPYTYNWNNGATTQTASNLAAGTYNVTVTGAGNCTATATVSIISSGGLTLTPNWTSTSCGNNNGSASVTATGGSGTYTYSWSGGGSGSSLSNLAAGTYTVTVNDNAGCSSTSSMTINPSGNGSVHITAANPIMCAGDSMQVCADNTYNSYLWNTGATTQCIYAHTAGNYYVTVTDAGNCTATSNHVPVQIYPLPPVSISVNGDTLTAYNAVTYQWYLNGGAINGATNHIYIATQNGTYTLAITDTNGCRVTSNPISINTVGIASLLEGEPLRVYPNPLENGYWTLETGVNAIGSKVEIFDDNGRLVYFSEIVNAKSEIELNVASGIYMMRVSSAKHAVTLKLIKL